MVKKKILFLQPTLQPPGGANTVTAWMLEALKGEYDITTLTGTQVELSEVNRYYGTSLQQTDLNSLVLPAGIRFLIGRLSEDPWHYLRYCALMRWCRMIQHRYELVMTANSETDFGTRGIQYVHFPYARGNYSREVQLYERNDWYVNMLRFLDTRLRPWRLLSGFSFPAMKENLTLVNSEWTGGYFQRAYDAQARVIYPPVPGDFPKIDWQEKENGFVCIGRFSGEKKLEEIIDMLAQVRKHAPGIHLHIIGSKVTYDEDYYPRLKTKVAEHASWIFLEENLSRDELIELLCAHRYGIHGMKDEHFGIAVAEMIRAGCIPFVPDSGGQVEIVGREPRLLYGSDAEAVEKILDVLEHPKEQQALLKHLASRGDLFSTKKFMHQIREVVAEFLQNKQQNGNGYQESPAKAEEIIESHGFAPIKHG